MEAKRVHDEAALLALADRHLLGNYRPARMILERGQGCEVFDTEGRRYLDFCAGVAVCSLGHAHWELTRAIATQAGTLMQTSNYFYNEQNVLLAAELCETTGFDRAFFCNSGAEANEAMLKIARRHAYRSDPSGARHRIVAFHKAFHGRTMGALAMTGNPAYLEGFGPHVGGIDHVAYGDVAAVERAMGPDVAAIIVEPVQGEGGVNVPPSDYLPALRRICDDHGALLLIDEIQVGVGRTGTFLGSEHSGVAADAITLAKGLGGGFPIGAMLVRERLADSLPAGTHGSTFGGNPLASVAARTVLRTIREHDLGGRARVLGERLSAGLTSLAAKHPRHCTGERGLGLLRAITLAEGTLSRDLLSPARDAGLLLTAAGPNALRFTPPLVVSEAEIDEAVEKTDAMFSALP